MRNKAAPVTAMHNKVHFAETDLGLDREGRLLSVATMARISARENRRKGTVPQLVVRPTSRIVARASSRPRVLAPSRCQTSFLVVATRRRNSQPRRCDTRHGNQL